MVEQTVYVQATETDIQKALSLIPQQATSSNPVSNAMLKRIGIALLRKIKQAFIIKSQGGTDEAGDSWVSLSPKTIAYTRRAGRTRAEKKRKDRPSQALNTSQRERWWNVYKQGLAIFDGNKASAAKRAWGILKREGATTLLQKYGGRQVKILHDSGELESSLSPYGSSKYKIFRIENGKIIVGTSRPGAKQHHEGNPRRKLPQRRLWPSPDRWPSTWWTDIMEEAKVGIMDIALSLIKGS